MTALTTFQRTHSHHYYHLTQFDSTNPIRCITETFDAHDWDAVKVLYRARVNTLRERKQRERERTQRLLLNMEPEETRLRQRVAKKLAALSTFGSPRKERSRTRKTTGERSFLLAEDNVTLTR